MSHSTPDNDRWSLWDAGNLISLHPTEQEAFGARDDHLARLASWNEADLQGHQDAVEIVDNESESQ